MIEFALVFPLLLFFLVATIDMGMAVLYYAGLQDAAYSTARAAAQAGGANVGTPPIVRTALENAIGNIPGHAGQSVQPLDAGASPGPGQVGYRVITGSPKCTVTGPSAYVTVDVSSTPHMITPGIGSVLNFLDSGNASGDWTMHATAVARCEVVLP